MNKTVLFFLLTSFFTNLHAQKSAQELFKKAHEKANAADFDAAINLFTEAIRLKPDFTLAFFDRGTIFYSKRNYENAIEDFTKVLSLKPDFPEVYFLRGNSYYFIKELDSACRDYKYADTYGYDKAKEKVNTVCKDSALKNPNRFFHRGNNRFNQQNYENALADYTKAIEYKPDFTMAYVMRGLVYDETGSYQLALNDFSKAIELDPKNPEFYIHRSFSYFNLNRNKEACLDLRKAVELGSKKAIDLLATKCK